MGVALQRKAALLNVLGMLLMSYAAARSRSRLRRSLLVLYRLFDAVPRTMASASSPRSGQRDPARPHGGGVGARPADGIADNCRRTRQPPRGPTQRSRLTDARSPGGRTADPRAALHPGALANTERRAPAPSCVITRGARGLAPTLPSPATLAASSAPIKCRQMRARGPLARPRPTAKPSPGAWSRRTSPDR